MKSLEYHRPETLEEALELLATYRSDARVLAGGTAVAILIKEGLLDATHLISLDRLSLEDVCWRDGVLHIGALVTLQAAADHPLVQAHAPILTEVLCQVASRRIRNVATMGGNLCWAEPASDPPGLLTALDAEVEVSSTRGMRHLPLRNFFVDYFATLVEPDELLTNIRVSPPPRGAGVTYIKFTPQSKADKPVLGVTALVQRAPDDTVEAARVVIGAAGPTPLALPLIDREARGRPMEPDTLALLADAYAEAAQPVSDSRGSERYKRAMIRVLVRRAVQAAWESSAAMR